jgi:hypothetical protein
MEQHKRMPKLHEPPELLQLFRQLAIDGLRWIEAELALTKAEAGSLLRGYMAGIALAILCFALTITTSVILAQAGAIALTPFVSSPAYAYLSVGLALALIVVVLSFATRYLFVGKHRTASMISKWIVNAGSPERMKK